MPMPDELSNLLVERYRASVKTKNLAEKIIFPWLSKFQTLISEFEKDTGLTFGGVRVNHLRTFSENGEWEPSQVIVERIDVEEI